ncbi:MAG: nucleotidyltransferase domain-containing protein [bacterium]
MDKILSERLDLIEEICKKYRVENLYAFGSSCTNRFTELSDLDFLINFEKNISIEEYTDNYFFIIDEFEKIFSRKIEILTTNSLSNPYFLKTLEKTKKLLYERRD